jgi:hypothetical protein
MSKSAARRKRNQQHSGQHRSEHTGQPAQPVSKSKPAPAPARKVHGPWLTAVLVYIGLDGILSAILLFAFKKDPTAVIPPWMMGAAALVALATIGSAVALWYWQRWGLYLLVAATLGSIALGIMALPTAAMVVAFHAIIPLLILLYVLQGQKKMPLLA